MPTEAYVTNKEVVKIGRPPSLGEPGVRPKPKEPTLPPEPADADAIPPNPTALGFRTAAETCGKCTYMEGNMCSHPLIAQPVSAGDSCAAFEAKGDMAAVGVETEVGYGE